MKSADKINSFSIYGVFLITLINFLIAAFSGTNMTIASKPSDSDIGEGPPVAPADPSV